MHMALVLGSGSKSGTSVLFPEEVIIFRSFRGLGQTSRVGSGRVGSPEPARPAKILGCLDLTRPDPRDLENPLTRPDPTREI